MPSRQVRKRPWVRRHRPRRGVRNRAGRAPPRGPLRGNGRLPGLTLGHRWRVIRVVGGFGRIEGSVLLGRRRGVDGFRCALPILCCACHQLGPTPSPRRRSQQRARSNADQAARVTRPGSPGPREAAIKVPGMGLSPKGFGRPAVGSARAPVPARPDFRPAGDAGSGSGGCARPGFGSAPNASRAGRE